MFLSFLIYALFREIHGFKVEFPNPSFGTANLKPYKTVNTHPNWSTKSLFRRKQKGLFNRKYFQIKNDHFFIDH